MQPASDHYRDAVRNNPRHAEALHGLARLEPDDEERAALLEEVIAIEPGHLAANINLANAFSPAWAWGSRVAANSRIQRTVSGRQPGPVFPMC